MPVGPHYATNDPGETYIGRHRAPEAVGPGYSPLDPATRQGLAPTHYAERRLPAGVDDRTWAMPAIADGGDLR